MDHCQEEVLSVLDALMPNHAPVRELEYLPSGFSNRNFVVLLDSGKYILRMCNFPPNDPKSEVSYLNLPIAPTLVAYDRVNGHMITEFFEGTLLVDDPFTVQESAEYVRKLHADVPMGVRIHNPVEVTLAHFRRADKFNELRSFVESTSWQPRLLVGSHNDLNACNVIRSTNRENLTLDWEFAGDNEDIFDVVNLCHGLCYTDEETEECARLYSGDSYDSDYFHLTRRVFQCREHAWALSQIAQGNDRPEIRQQVINAQNEYLRLTHLKPCQNA